MNLGFTISLANAAGTGQEVLTADWALVRGFAVLSMEERAVQLQVACAPSLCDIHKHCANEGPSRIARSGRPRSSFSARNSNGRDEREEGIPKNQTAEEKRVSAIRRKPLSAEIESALFDYDTGFLQGLGMSLSGYSLFCSRLTSKRTAALHPAHSCTLNASVRHLDQRRASCASRSAPSQTSSLGRSYSSRTWIPWRGKRSAVLHWRCEGRDWKPPEGQWRI
ncbi:hypothetical protein K438DRAFT_1867721, partial [Mycena galopus ATCC 62051]